jgi:hypothetical protein
LLAVVMEYDEFDLLQLDQIQQFLGAGAQLLLIVVNGRGLAIHAKGALQGHGVNGQKNRTSFWQANEHRLMTGNMAARFEERDAGEKFNVPFHEAITQSGMIPMLARGRETRMTVARPSVMLALNDEFGGSEVVVIAGVIDIEMRADQMSISCGCRFSAASCSRTFVSFSLEERGAVGGGASGAIPVSISMRLLSLVSTR